MGAGRLASDFSFSNDIQVTINTTKHTSGVGGCFFKSGARDTPWFTSFRLWRFFLIFFFEYGLGGRRGKGERWEGL